MRGYAPPLPRVTLAVAGALLAFGLGAVPRVSADSAAGTISDATGGGSPGDEGVRRRKAPGYPVPDEALRRKPPPPPSGNLHLHDPYRDESLKINIYDPDGSYNVEALRALSQFLRCRRTGTVVDMEPRLFAVLSHVFDHFGERPIEVTSGYRNQRRSTSNHHRGSATDIFIGGVKPKDLRAFVETLDAGGLGVGLYPKSGFVHVDIRPPPSYRWIDRSARDPDDPDRRPPPILKQRKRRLQS